MTTEDCIAVPLIITVFCVLSNPSGKLETLLIKVVLIKKLPGLGIYTLQQAKIYRKTAPALLDVMS